VPGVREVLLSLISWHNPLCIPDLRTPLPPASPGHRPARLQTPPRSGRAPLRLSSFQQAPRLLGGLMLS